MALTTAKDAYRAAFEPLPGSVYHTPFPYCYRAAGGPHASVGLHLRLGGAARPALPPDRRSIEGRRRSSSSRSSARVATWSRRRRSCRGSARSPGNTASCSSPTRSRPASGGPARCSRSSTGMSSPTSWSWPRASRRGCRCPGSSPGRELMASAGSRAPTAGPTAATSCHARRPTPRSTSSRKRTSSPTPAPAAPSSLGGLRELQADHPAIGDVRGLGLHGRDGVRPAGHR